MSSFWCLSVDPGIVNPGFVLFEAQTPARKPTFLQTTTDFLASIQYLYVDSFPLDEDYSKHSKLEKESHLLLDKLHRNKKLQELIARIRVLHTKLSKGYIFIEHQYSKSNTSYLAVLAGSLHGWFEGLFYDWRLTNQVEFFISDPRTKLDFAQDFGCCLRGEFQHKTVYTQTYLTSAFWTSFDEKFIALWSGNFASSRTQKKRKAVGAEVATAAATGEKKKKRGTSSRLLNKKKSKLSFQALIELWIKHKPAESVLPTVTLLHETLARKRQPKKIKLDDIADAFLQAVGSFVAVKPTTLQDQSYFQRDRPQKKKKSKRPKYRSVSCIWD